jgi:hypothetical protein
MTPPWTQPRYLYQFRVVLGLLHDTDSELKGQVQASSREEALQLAREQCKALSRDLPQWRQSLLPKLTIEVQLMGPTAL